MIAISPSALDAWFSCRLRFQYLKTKGEQPTLDSNLLRGSAGHAAMEVFYAAEPKHRTLDLLLSNAQQALSEIVAEYEKTFGSLASWDEEDADKAGLQVVRALTTYWKTFGNEAKVPPLETEVRLSRQLPNGHEFHGVADGVQREAGRVTLWEFKFPYSSPYLDNYLYWSPQHRYYGWMLDTELPVYVRYNLVTATKVVRPDDFLVLPCAMEEAAAVAAQVADEIERTTVYLPNYAYHCGRCSFKDECLTRLTGGSA